MLSVRGDRVLLERRSLSMNQYELANSVGVNQSYISQIERGRDVNIGIKTLGALAEALGVSAAYLLGMTDDPLGAMPEEELKEEATTVRESSAAYLVGEFGRVYAKLSPTNQIRLLFIAKALLDADTPHIVE